MQDNLYELIKSLSRSEQSLLKRMDNDKDQKYFQIYKAIKKLIKANKSYDEALIIKQLNINNFSRNKHSLHEKILDILYINQSKQQHNSSLSVQRDVVKAQILLGRGLTEHAKKRLDKAKNKAEENEQYSLILDIIDIQLEMLLASKTDPTSSLNELLKERESCLESQKRKTQYLDIITQLHTLQVANAEQNNNTEKLTIIIEQDAVKHLKKNLETLSFEEKTFYYRIYSLYYYLSNNKTEFYNAAQQGYQLFSDKNISKIQLYPKTYFALYCNYLAACFMNGNEEDLLKGIKHLMEQSKQNIWGYWQNVEEEVLLRTRILNYNYYKLTKRYEKIIDDINFIDETFLASGKINERDKIDLSFLIIHAFYKEERYDDALKRIEQLKKDNPWGKQVSLRLYVIARIKEMAIQYKKEGVTDDEKGVTKLNDQFHTYLKRNRNHYTPTNYVKRFRYHFDKLISLSSIKYERNRRIDKFMVDMKEIKKSNMDKDYFDLFNVIEWLQDIR